MNDNDGKKVKILIVEDEGIIARDLQYSIKNFGWICIGVARSGREALDMAAEIKPDIVLMDIKLDGEIDGIETARRMKFFMDAPIIYLTAFTNNEVLERAKATLPYGYLVKPVEERHLQVTVEMALYKSKLDRDLKDKEKWLSMILENLDEGVVAADIKGRVQFINRAAEKHTGWSREEAVNMPIEHVLTMINESTGHPVNVPFVKTMLDEETIPIGESSLLKARHATPITVDGKCVPVSDEQNNITGAMLVFHDISLRKQLEGRLRQARKMEAIGALAGGIAHDFNNILSVILGYTDLALAREHPPEKYKHYMENVHSASLRARELVKQILSFSRQTDKVNEPIQIGLVIKEELKLIKSSVPRGITIKSAIESLDSFVQIDPTHLHQVIMNLYTNALHAMEEEGGTLGIRLENQEVREDEGDDETGLKPGFYVVLSVSDTGTGIDPGDLPRIFEPFFTTKEHEIGTGIGLAIIRGMIENYGGAILVDSICGRGTTFHVYFPLCEDPGDAVARSHEPTPRGCERLLFIDDEAAFVELGEDLLGQLGYQVDGYSNPANALEQFKIDPDYDIAVLDLVMSPINGVDLTMELRKLRPDLPVVLCTGFSGRIDKNILENAGIRHVLMKPMVLKEMAIALRDALENPPTLRAPTEKQNK